MAYVTIGIAQAAIVTGGIVHSEGKDPPISALLCVIHAITFGILFVGLEIWVRIYRSKEVPYEKPSKTLSRQEFDQRVLQGESLVILDDLILDVGEYLFEHPGGSFLLEHLIGQDVSKYFYGGYALEASRGDKPWFHSNVSRVIVNSLIVARLNDNAPVVIAKVQSNFAINESTTAYFFQVTGSRTLKAPGITDVSCIGRHYLIRAKNMPKVKRQYTLCQSLNPDIHDVLHQAIKKASKVQTLINEDKQALAENPSKKGEIFMVIKNYSIPGGFSDYIAEA